MDFDQILETWRGQEAKPPYVVNRDALRQALQTEEASVQRVRRRDIWVACILGGGGAIVAGWWLGALIYQSDTPVIYTVAAAAGLTMVATWLGAYCLTRWRQAKSERNFGNTLLGEVRRALARVDTEISRFGSWSASALQVAPIMVGAMLVAWSISGSQGDGSGVSFIHWWMYVMNAFCTIYLVRLGHRYAKQKLEPRQRRLRELLAVLDTRE
jgi:hypothetical protein